MSKGVEELKRELQECKDEVPKMQELREKIRDILTKKMATGDVLKRLEEQGVQLDKDIENYKHMLEEADDLRKSWEKDESKMGNINTGRRFNESANIFELPIHDLVNMNEKQIAPAKSVADRVKFTRYDAGGGEISDLPVLFEFGLLGRHNMGGWEVSEEQLKDDHFSFTFRWDEENYTARDVLDELRIKATSIVVLWDEETSTIVNFDVEPGFEHQWGYGRQRFLKQSTISANSNKVRAQAIIKEWSEQHEYELGKYAIDLLRQSKANRGEISRHIQFIVDQANQESAWSTEKKQLEQEKQTLTQQVTVLTQTKEELRQQKETLEATILELRLEIANKTTQLETQSEQIVRLTAEKEAAEKLAAEGGKIQEQQQQTTGSSDPTDTGSAQVGRDPRAVIARLEGDLATKDTEIAALKAEIDDLKKQLEAANAIQTSLDECRDKTAALEAEVAAKQATIDDLTAKGADALATVTQLNTDKDTLQAKINELEANIARLAELVKQQAQANDDLQAKLDKAAADAAEDKAEADAAQAQLQNIIGEKEAEVASEKETNKGLNAKITVLEANVVQQKKKIQIVSKKHNACRDQLVKAKADLDTAKDNARKAIELLQGIIALDDPIVPDAVDVDELQIDIEEEKTDASIKQTTVEVSDGTDPAPATVTPVTTPEEPVIEATNVTEAKTESSSSDSDAASDVEEELSSPPTTDTVPENVRDVTADEDVIIAEKQSGKESPIFFPPKGEETPAAEEAEPEPEPAAPEPTSTDKISETAASETSAAKKQRKGSKSLAKFDLKMGLSKKDSTKESGFSKFINMCTRGGSKKEKQQTIEPEDPQVNPPASP